MSVKNLLFKKIPVAFGAALVASTLLLAGGLSGPAQAKDKGDLLVRMRGLAVIPQENGTTDALGGSVSVDEAYVPELDFTYFFTKNIAVELILATTKHKVDLKNPNVNLGSVWLLPPTLTAQYHFFPDGKFSPYIGAGVNYTFFYNEDRGALTNITYDDGFGFALQAGIDMKLNERWSLNLDVKKIFLSTDVSANNNTVHADVDIHPWIIGLGIGYRF